jgi:hypothetical protein
MEKSPGYEIFTSDLLRTHSYFSHAKGRRLQLRSPTYSSLISLKKASIQKFIKPEQLLAENWAHAEDLMIHPRQISGSCLIE